MAHGVVALISFTLFISLFEYGFGLKCYVCSNLLDKNRCHESDCKNFLEFAMEEYKKKTVRLNEDEIDYHCGKWSYDQHNVSVVVHGCMPATCREMSAVVNLKECYDCQTDLCNAAVHSVPISFSAGLLALLLLL